MRAHKSIFLILIVLFFIAGCNKDDGERLKGSMKFSTVTTGTIDASYKYLFTFSDLVGEEIPNGILLGPNSDTTIAFNRVGEQLSMYMMEVPTTCGNISSTSTNTISLPIENPSEPGAVFGVGFLIPIDGSTGEIKFTIICN